MYLTGMLVGSDPYYFRRYPNIHVLAKGYDYL